ncbi:MAG: helix-turn-helix domain-containing protein [Candidatus Paceibacterota bacterium]
MTRTNTIRKKVLELRKEGYSYNYISKQTGISKSTLSEWLYDIPFVPNQHTLETIKNARLASGVYKYKNKMKSVEMANLQAKKDVGNLSKRDIMMLGVGLYIGEGGKTDGLTRIINSDPKVIKFALKWLKTSFGINIKNIKIRLFIYPDNIEKDCVEYWSKSTGIPISQFFKSTIDNRINKKTSNKGKLPFGTAHLSVKSLGDKKLGVYLQRLIVAWINTVLC